MSDPASEPSKAAVHDALVAGLAVQARQLTEAASDLRESNQRTAEAVDDLKASYRLSRRLKVALTVGMAVFVVNLVMLGQLLALAHSNASTGAAIKSCTTPQGECYQRGQRSQGQAVAQIVAAVNNHTDIVFVTTLVCMRATTTDKAFEGCLAAKGINER